jgi:hypothetical protein
MWGRTDTHTQNDVFKCLFYFLKKAECGRNMMYSMTDLP